MRKAVIFFLILGASSVWGWGQEWAIEKLARSPRHQEWVTVQQTDREVQAFLVYPEVEVKTAAVVVIHENRGLSDWIRSVADDLAAEGYLAIAPDLLSGEGRKTSDFPDSDAARQAIYQLSPEQVTADLKAVVEYVSTLPAASGTVAVAGFCWGGSQTFRFATTGADLAAAFVFYGRAPDDAEAIARIRTPVYGFYGGADNRVNATLPRTEELMRNAGKTFEPVIYPGAGHGFLRRGEEPGASGPNREAYLRAWERLKLLLGAMP